MRLTKSLPILLLLAPLASSCLADVGDDPLGEAEEPGVGWRSPDPPMLTTPDRALRAWAEVHTGPCATACEEAFLGACEDEHAVCYRPDAQPDDVITCGGHALTCAEAHAASTEGLPGLSACWRSCEGLR